jgi:hypothetical protein
VRERGQVTSAINKIVLQVKEKRQTVRTKRSHPPEIMAKIANMNKKATETK